MSSDINGVKALKGARVAFASRVKNTAALKLGTVQNALANGVDILTDSGRLTFRYDRTYAITAAQGPTEVVG